MARAGWNAASGPASAKAAGSDEGGRPAKAKPSLGIGMPPVLLLHGFAQSACAWDGVSALIAAEGVRTYAFDMAEIGAPDYSFETFARTLDAKARAIAAECGRPPVLVGYSQGGRVALETVLLAMGGSCDAFAHRLNQIALPPACGASVSSAPVGKEAEGFPFAALVLESAGLGPASESAREKLAQRNAGWAASLRTEGTAAFMAWWETLPLFATQLDLPTEIRVAQRADREACSAETLARMLEGIGQHNQTARDRALEMLTACPVPLAYLAGELDGGYLAQARVLSAAVPCARVFVVPGAGHNTHLEQPATFVAVLNNFMKGLL